MLSEKGPLSTRSGHSRKTAIGCADIQPPRRSVLVPKAAFIPIAESSQNELLIKLNITALSFFRLPTHSLGDPNTLLLNCIPERVQA